MIETWGYKNGTERLNNAGYSKHEAMLYDIRKSLRDKEGAISRRMSAILKKAQEEGIVDSDAGVSVRDGKMLIPVSAANKKRIAGFIYDESATGKTAFIEPAEVVELDNQIKELKFAEQREILRILLEFTDFLRPYIPDLLDAARYLGEIDFLMAKAQISLDFIAKMLFKCLSYTLTQLYRLVTKLLFRVLFPKQRT